MPEVVAFVSGFNYSIVASDSSLGIGLDMYLGKEYEYYFNRLKQLIESEIEILSNIDHKNIIKF